VLEGIAAEVVEMLQTLFRSFVAAAALVPIASLGGYDSH